jgi:VIT1/CCC1 family predicted Fe2+/Mn2+ transporter
LFSAERAYLENERKEYISSEMKAIEAEVQTIITNAIKAYISSNQENYPKSEKMINSIIKIITSHDDNNLISYAEEEMGKFGLA